MYLLTCLLKLKQKVKGVNPHFKLLLQEYMDKICKKRNTVIYLLNFTRLVHEFKETKIPSSNKVNIKL